MHGSGADSQVLPAPGELTGEQHVRQLARLVRAQPVIAVSHVQVGWVHLGVPGGARPAGGRDDAGPGGRERAGSKHGQEERSEVVDLERELLLEAKLAEIEERRDKLRQMSEFLRSKLNDLPAVGGLDGGDVLTAAVGEQS